MAVVNLSNQSVTLSQVRNTFKNNVKELSLSSCSFKTGSAELLFEEVIRCRTLERLLLSTAFPFRGKYHLLLIRTPISLNLIELSLRSQDLKSKELRAINRGLNRNNVLKRLTAYGCNINSSKLVECLTCSLESFVLDISIAPFLSYKLLARSIQEGTLASTSISVNLASTRAHESYKKIAKFLLGASDKSQSIESYTFTGWNLDNIGFSIEEKAYLTSVKTKGKSK